MDLYFGISASRRAPAYARRSGDAPAVWDGTSEMWAALYVFTVCFVALTLFAAVHELRKRSRGNKPTRKNREAPALSKRSPSM